ncbi:MAG: DNA adenine methylase [Anaerolineaceae bacterium 4572_5.1]|nr:MAG: DNA adenine methylase [Anaerolineaceae bacterium 4572_5.1]
MQMPHPIPYQGSKRNLAKDILPFFPKSVNTLIEPFAGSAAISIASAYGGKASHFLINDLNKPLMELLKRIINTPEEIAESYEKLWTAQLGNKREYYDSIRDEFNKTHNPDYLLYLLARCVKASVRYNSQGEFNQSPDNRRKGKRPITMKKDILAVSKLLKEKTQVLSLDYKEILAMAKKTDLIYMDPPYQGVCATGDPRYYSGIDFDDFMQELEKLTSRGISFILSYDGRSGRKTYGIELPSELGMKKIEINAGRSSQSTLLGGDDITYESIYLSKNLVKKLNYVAPNAKFYAHSHQPAQPDLF